jgi:catechol 2,3-dioxygenase-like lactoylglutathione lyase family enzyme
MHTTGVYHVGINCTDLARSLSFYKMLGFEELIDFGLLEGEGVDQLLGRPGCRARAKMIGLGHDPRTSHIDLLEWEVAGDERPAPRVHDTGIVRMCIYTRDIWADYAELVAKGVRFYSEPQSLNDEGSTFIVCFEDPDGTILELMQVVRPDD